MTKYDPEVIQKFADRLYAQAQRVIFSYTVIVAIVFCIAFVCFEKFAHVAISGWIGLFIGGVIGYLMGLEKAFKLKLEAQTALCQVQIEENTRKN